MKGKTIFKALLGAYLLTTLLLLLLAFLLFKFDLRENMVNAGITVIYIISCFLGGFVAGKGTRRRKYFWGALTGAVYFVLLAGASLIANPGEPFAVVRLVITLALCVGSGMLGGMLA